MPDLDPPIEPLFGAVGDQDLPDRLAESYGSGLGLPEDVVFANFVSSIDGVVAIGGLGPSSSVISGRDPGDRFVMALLRAAADVVLVGAGTFRDHGGPWTAAASFPDAEDAFAELRRREGRSPEPPLAVVTASGAVEPKEDGSLEGAIVLTTEKGAAALEGTGADVITLDDEDGQLEGARIVERLHERGFRRILTEGGPRLMAQLVEDRVVDELFLTVSPVFAGEGDRGERPSLTPGVELLPHDRRDAVLHSVRRRGSYLFVRYRLAGGRG